MLVAKHRASTQITDVKRTDKSVVLRSKAEQIQFIPISESAVRVICTKADTQKKEQELTQGDSIKRSNQMNSVQWELNEDSESISVILSYNQNRSSGGFHFVLQTQWGTPFKGTR